MVDLNDVGVILPGEVVEKQILQPALHKPIPMGSRVVVPDSYLKEKGITGTVAGISSTHILFTYIVILDKEVETDYGTVNNPYLKAGACSLPVFQGRPAEH